MKNILKPADLLAMEPRLLVSLEKSAQPKQKGGWSETARAASAAAKKAKVGITVKVDEKK